MKKILAFIVILLLVGMVVIGVLGATGNLDNFKDGLEDLINRPSIENPDDETPDDETPDDEQPSQTNILTISETDAKLENTEARGDYYSLDTNKTYSFTIDLEKSFGSTDVELSYRLDAFGQVYLWDCYGADSGVWVNTSEAQLYSLASIMDRFVQNLSISENVLTLKTGYRPLTNSYSSTHSDETYNFTIYEGHFVELIDASTVSPDFEPDNEYAAYNVEHISAYVFYIIVSDSNSGIEKSLPFWIPCAFYDYDPY